VECKSLSDFQGFHAYHYRQIIPRRLRWRAILVLVMIILKRINKFVENLEIKNSSIRYNTHMSLRTQAPLFYHRQKWLNF